MALDFAFSKADQEFRTYVRDFASCELAPHSSLWDREGVLPWDAIRKMAEAGLLGLIGPRKLGGQERSFVSLGIAIEELARADLSCAMICWLQTTLAGLIPGWGDETIRAVHRGEQLVCLATSEEDAGSDVSAMTTVARVDGSDYVVTGRKIHVSLVPGAQVMGVTARVPSPDGKARITMLRVPADAPGVTTTLMEQMGARAHRLGAVDLDGVRIPTTATMGDSGRGKAALNARFNVSRCLSPLAGIGAAQATLEDTIDYARKKVVFGRPIASNQAISFPLVEHLTRLEAARLLAYRALWMNDQGEDASTDAAMAKWFGIRSSVDAISDCLSMHGANGFLTAHPYEQRLRDVTALLFTGGTINIMKILAIKNIIGREFAGIDRPSGDDH